jgi:hypothetical protein
MPSLPGMAALNTVDSSESEVPKGPADVLPASAVNRVGDWADPSYRVGLRPSRDPPGPVDPRWPDAGSWPPSAA